MHTFLRTSALLIAVAINLIAAPEDVAQHLQTQYGDAVVTLQAVAEIQGRERELESFGTMIDAQGTVVVAHSRFTSYELNEVKLLLADGTELEAKVILTDPDLDIAFIQPDLQALDGEDSPFTYLALSDTLVDLQPADEVMILTRESDLFRRQSSVLLGSVETVLDAPRRYYRTNVRPSGTPAFSMDGKFIGVFARRVQGDKAHHRVILPSPAILKAYANLPNVTADVPQASQDGNLKATAKRLLDSYGDSIIMVEATGDIIITVGEQNQTITQTFRGPCVALNKQGLIVGPNFSKSITQQVTSQLRNQLGGANVEVNVAFEFGKIKMLLSDGTELAAKLVFLDSHLNLSFIEPDKDQDADNGDEEHVFVAVNLEDDVDATLFEELLTITRYGEDLNRALSVASGRVTSIQQKPRMIYRTEIGATSAPVFNKDAKLVGFMAPNKESQGSVLLPAKAVRKAVEQYQEDSAID